MAERETFEAATYTGRGTAREKVELPAETFDGTVNMPVMHQAVKAYLANQRQGNASTKTRGFVTGGNQKPWKQKGTGRARQGSTRAPHWVGGGTVFGPLPRSYAQYVPRKVRLLARKSAFNARAREGAIFVIDAFGYDAPKTSRLMSLLARLDVSDRKVLVLTDGAKPNVYLSGRNLPSVHVMPYADASTYHILWSDVVLIEASAIGQTLQPIEEQEPADEPPARKPARRRAAGRTAEEGEGETSATRTRAAKKTAARKTTAKKAGGRTTAAKKTSARKTSARKGSAGKKSAAKSPSRGATAKKSAKKKKEK